MTVIIAGGGIGGLAAALQLHRAGITVEVHERVAALKPLGVGITLLPHAVASLARLGLLDALDAVAVRTSHLYFRTRHGQDVWDEPRGLAAGYDVPQFTIHRADLHRVLLDAVAERLPAGAVRLDSGLVGVEEQDSGVRGRFRSQAGVEIAAEGALLIGADGIHSAVRRYLHPDEGAPRWSGLMLWRGSTDWPPFMDGHSIINSGGIDRKFIFYPIAEGSTPGTQRMNWALVTREAAPGGEPPAREAWDAEARYERIAPLLDSFAVRETDIHAMVRATGTFWEFPMCDRDPLDWWGRGRITLLGDAAHPMYPFGANGAAQAILDAEALGRALAEHGETGEALAAYEAERRPKVNEVVANNRTGGPEKVIDEVERRAPEPFADVEAVLPRSEREAIVKGYSRIAGYDRDQLSTAAAEARR